MAKVEKGFDNDKSGEFEEGKVMERRGGVEEEVKKESWAVKEGKEEEEGPGRGRLRDGAKKESRGLAGSVGKGVEDTKRGEEEGLGIIKVEMEETERGGTGKGVAARPEALGRGEVTGLGSGTEVEDEG